MNRPATVFMESDANPLGISNSTPASKVGPVNELKSLPMGCGRALFVCADALVWSLFSDRVKLVACRIFDPAGAPLLAIRRPGTAGGSAKGMAA